MVKPARVVTIAMLAAMAVVGLVSAGSASAFWKLQTYCQIPAKLCPKFATDPLVQFFGASATSPVFKGSVLVQKCTQSKLGYSSLSEGATEATVKGEVEEFTFTGCTPCSAVSVTSIPASADASSSSKVGDGVLKTALSVRFTGCAFGATCKFTSSSVTLDIVGAETGGEIRASGEVLTLAEGSEFLCGKAVEWTANYVVNIPFFVVPERESLV